MHVSDDLSLMLFSPAITIFSIIIFYISENEMSLCEAVLLDFIHILGFCGSFYNVTFRVLRCLNLLSWFTVLATGRTAVIVLSYKKENDYSQTAYK